MKTPIISTITTLTCLSCLGQGTVNFANINSGAGLNAPIYYCSVEKISGPDYKAALLAGSSTTTLTQISETPLLTGAAAGYFNGGVVAIPGIPGGGAAWIQIRVWDSTLGGTTNDATYAEAQSSILAISGASAVFSVVTGDPGSIPPGLPAALVGLSSINLGPLSPDHGVFIIQPTNQTVLAGTTVTFYARATSCPFPNYQWYYNGTLIPEATNSNYQITNVQLIDAGNYWVLARNPSWGELPSATATLTVQGFLAFTSQPLSQTVVVGSNAGFAASVSGGPPYAFQWLFNGSPVQGATQSTLLLVNVQPAQAGAYTVVVTNAVGAMNSMPAMLNVIPPVELRWVPGLVLTGQSGMLLNLETNDVVAPLANWAAFDNLVLANASQWYFDLSSPLPTQRFYRAWQTNNPGLPPALQIHMIPALTLTGAMGSKVRVDAINQFGPTDAWFPLATVTLTNTSQLYFDITTPGAPPRLYRLVASP